MSRAALLLFLSCCTSVLADERVSSRGAELVLSGEGLGPQKQLRFFSPLQIQVRVEGGASLEVEPVDVKVDPREWSIVHQTRGEWATLAEGRRRWSRDLVLEARAPVKLQLPVITLRHRGGPGQDWVRSHWEGIVIDVIGPTKEESSEVRGQFPIEDVPPAPPSIKLPLAEVVIGVTIAAILALLIVYRLRASPRNRLSPQEQALLALTSIPPGEGSTTHVQVAEVLRRYLEDQFGIQAPRRTTEELLTAARNCSSLAGPSLKQLEAILGACDRIKFSGGVVVPAREENAKLVEEGIQFIQATGSGPAG